MKKILALGLLLLIDSSIQFSKFKIKGRRGVFSNSRHNRRLRPFHHHHQFIHSSGLSLRYVSSSDVNFRSNRCGLRCCNGWSWSKEGHCTVPLCKNRCQYVGKCIAPNTCKCPDGSLRSTCPKSGFSFVANRPKGFLMKSYQHRGTRQSFNRYRPRSKVPVSSIERPQVTNFPSRRLLRLKSSRTQNYGICYRSSGSRLCGVALKGKMTSGLCCRGIGDAWGPSCSSCLSIRGFSSSSSQNRIRRPLRQRKCKRGYRVFRYNFCQDINECLAWPKKCKHGRCLNTPGSYQCSCFRGYQRSKDKQACSATEKTEKNEEKCYLNVESNGKCGDYERSYRNKSECCCLHGIAWGEKCELCPAAGSEEKRQLCVYQETTEENLTPKVTTVANQFQSKSQKTFQSLQSTSAFKLTRNNATIHRWSSDPQFTATLSTLQDVSANRELRLQRTDRPSEKKLVSTTLSPIQQSENYQTSESVVTAVNNFKPTSYARTSRSTSKPSLPTEKTTSFFVVSDEDSYKMLRDIESITTNIRKELQQTFPNTEDMFDTMQRVNLLQNTKLYRDTAAKNFFNATSKPLTDKPDVFTVYKHFETTKPTSILKTKASLVENIERSAIVREEKEKSTAIYMNNHQTTKANLANKTRNAFRLKTKHPTLSATISKVTSTIKTVISNNASATNALSTSILPNVVGITDPNQFCDLCLNGGTCNPSPYVRGDVTCTCLQGFYGKFCDKEINECQMGSVCRGGTCVNTHGSFRCHCPTGYDLDPSSGSCIDIDDCLTEPCYDGAQCRDHPGFFQCDCPSKSSYYDEIKKKCIQITPDTVDPIATTIGIITEPRIEKKSLHQACYKDDGVCSSALSFNTTIRECCCALGRAWGENCQACPRMNAEFRKLCPYGRGFSSGKDRLNRIDIDECRLFDPTKICPNAKCYNNVGAFQCVCFRGFYYDKRIGACKDFNECHYLHKCGSATCVNLQGSFQCVCPEGTILKRGNTGASCVFAGFNRFQVSTTDSTTTTIQTIRRPRIKPTTAIQSTTQNSYIDPKAVGSCFARFRSRSCFAQFSQEMTYKSCCCVAGKAWGLNCLPCPKKRSQQFIDLCFLQNSRKNPSNNQKRCGNWNNCVNGDCVEQGASAICQCHRGYRSNSLTSRCEDVNECLARRHGRPCRADGIRAGRCVNTPGSYRCNCYAGFASASSDKACVRREIETQRFPSKRFF